MSISSFIFYCYFLLINKVLTTFFSTPLLRHATSYSIRILPKGFQTSMTFYIDFHEDVSRVASKLCELDLFTEAKRLGDDKVKINKETYNSLKLLNTFIFPNWNVTVKNIIFHYGNFSDTFISLSYKSGKNPESFINVLYNENMIKERMFSFIKVNEDLLYFGRPLDELKNKKFEGYCKIKKDNWGCNIINVYLGDYPLQYKNYALFDTRTLTILVPPKFIKDLETHIFGKLFDRNQCNYDTFYTHDVYICNCGILKKFPNITFAIGNYLYSVPPESLFFYFEDFCILNIEKNTEDYFVLGTTFLKLFDVNFHFDQQTITFSSNDTLIQLNPFESDVSELKEQINTCIICIIFLVFGCLLQSYNKLTNINHTRRN